MSHIRIGSVSIPTNEFVTSGSAALGIRKSGKTYAMKGVAEQLIEQGVPIIVFDAIGLWRFLKTPGDVKGKGFPVVVAGGEDPDIPLSPANTAEIIRSAMRSNVSLVIDLYDSKLSKADWRKIVQIGFHTLLYENKKYGHRYIILEEAAEFVPQKVYDGETFAAVEKVVRMGGNVGLGIGLINQRSQEVNKSVLDLCDNLILLRQRGSAAIDAVQKWMDKVNPEIADKITKSLPNLTAGRCWVWAENSEEPVETRTHTIRSFHPDRTKQHDTLKARKSVDTKDFVTKLLTDLPKVVAEQNEKNPDILRQRIRELERDLAKKLPPAAPALPPATKLEEVAVINEADRKLIGSIVWQVTALSESLQKVAKEEMEKIRHDLQPILLKIDRAPFYKGVSIVPPTGIRRVSQVAIKHPPTSGTSSSAPVVVTGDGISPVCQKILNALAELELLKVEKPVREIVALMAGYTHLASTGYVKATGQLRTAGYIDYPDSSTVALTDEGRRHAHYPNAPRNSIDVQNRVCSLLGGKCSEILKPLIDAYPNALPRMEVAQAANYTHLASTGFVKIIGKLRTLGFVEYPDSQSIKATSVLFLE